MTAFPLTAVAARRLRVLYHFGRLQLPAMAIAEADCARHLERTFNLANAKQGGALDLIAYFDGLRVLDWHLACSCLERRRAAWEMLFASRSGGADCLLVDALRSRAVRLYPRDLERQETAVSEFWSQLFAGEGGGLPILARYDGLRPLIPWLIRVFQNQHISLLRRHERLVPLPDEDLALPLQPHPEPRWREAFCRAAKESFRDLSEQEILVLGLAAITSASVSASILDRNEGNISQANNPVARTMFECDRPPAVSRRLGGRRYVGSCAGRNGRRLARRTARLSGDNLAGCCRAGEEPARRHRQLDRWTSPRKTLPSRKGIPAQSDAQQSKSGSNPCARQPPKEGACSIDIEGQGQGTNDRAQQNSSQNIAGPSAKKSSEKRAYKSSRKYADEGDESGARQGSDSGGHKDRIEDGGQPSDPGLVRKPIIPGQSNTRQENQASQDDRSNTGTDPCELHRAKQGAQAESSESARRKEKQDGPTNRGADGSGRETAGNGPAKRDHVWCRGQNFAVQDLAGRYRQNFAAGQ